VLFNGKCMLFQGAFNLTSDGPRRLLGEVVHVEGGYQNDCRFLLADEEAN